MLEGRNSKVDIIRGMAIILVMTGHGIDLLIKKNIMPEKLGWEIFDIIYMFHMPLFFLIAGYVYQSNCEKIVHIVIKNVITCYVPYLFLNYLYWIERAVASCLPGVHLDQSVTGFSWKELLRLSYGGDGLTWFLLSFMLVKILFNVLDTYVSEKAAFICFSVLFWMAFAFPQNRILGYLWWGIFFCLGSMIRKYGIDRLENRILTLVVCVNIIAFGIVRYRENHFDILVKLLIGCPVFLIYMLYARYIPDIKLFMLCGKYSMVIYMIHGLSQFLSFYIAVRIFHMQACLGIFGLMIVLQLLFSCAAVKAMQKAEWLQLIFYPYKYMIKKKRK